MAALCSIVLVTVPDSKVADSLAATLLEENFAACVNQIPGMKSSYWWEGKIQHAQEILLLVKTRSALIPALMDCVRKNHPYAVPEIIALAIADGSREYLDWIKFVTTPKEAPKK